MSSSAASEFTNAPPGAGSFSIFTSLRYDPLLLSSPANTTASSLAAPTPFYLLSHHRDRMLAAATHFSYPPASTAALHSLDAFAQQLQEAVDMCAYGGEGPLKLKPILERDGKFTVEVAQTPVVPLSQLFPVALPAPPKDRSDQDWKIVLDEAPTPPSSFTSFKTTARKVYDDARLRAWIQNFAEKKEVVLWNERHELMEGSVTSVYVFKDGQGWVTPEVGSGGQRGTTRRWILERGLAKEGLLKTGDVKRGSWVVVSNGVRGVWGGWAT